MLNDNNGFVAGTRSNFSAHVLGVLVGAREIFGGEITLNGLLVMQCVLVRHLDGELCRQKDVERELSIPKATVSRWVRLLVKHGTMIVSSGLEDSREKHLVPSDWLLEKRVAFHKKLQKL